MNIQKPHPYILLPFLFLFVTSFAYARDRASVVGSSTVYPFTTVVAERVGTRAGMMTPIVESTGTGGGIKLFCSGSAEKFPDAVNASRRMTVSEFESCKKSDVREIIELPIGIDGLVLATNVRGPSYKLSRKQIWQALANAGSKPTMWSEIDPSLPETKISVFLPPPTSGTRDSFHELVLLPGCPNEQRQSDKDSCELIRQDGAVVEVGENDALIVQKLAAEPGTIGIFGYSYLENNREKIRAVEIDSVSATADTIQDGSYPLARPLYVYFKKANIAHTPGLQELVNEFISENAIGDFGYLTDIGLIPFDLEKKKQIQTDIKSKKTLTLDSLQSESHSKQ